MFGGDGRSHASLTLVIVPQVANLEEEIRNVTDADGSPTPMDVVDMTASTGTPIVSAAPLPSDGNNGAAEDHGQWL